MTGTRMIALMILAVIVLLPLGVWIMQLLWNYVMPPMFGVPEIGFLQMGALWLLMTGLIGTGAGAGR